MRTIDPFPTAASVILSDLKRIKNDPEKPNQILLSQIAAEYGSCISEFLAAAKFLWLWDYIDLYQAGDFDGFDLEIEFDHKCGCHYCQANRMWVEFKRDRPR